MDAIEKLRKELKLGHKWVYHPEMSDPKGGEVVLQVPESQLKSYFLQGYLLVKDSDLERAKEPIAVKTVSGNFTGANEEATDTTDASKKTEDDIADEADDDFEEEKIEPENTEKSDVNTGANEEATDTTVEKIEAAIEEVNEPVKTKKATTDEKVDSKESRYKR